jgi:hypothetical protein
MTDQSDNDQKNETNRLDMHNNDTLDIPKDSPLYRRLSQEISEIASSAPGREISFIIRGITETRSLTGKHPLILGRTDLKVNAKPDLDLTPYGAQERGVSRQHVRLFVENNQLYAVDLGSSNGTRLNNERLTPNKPYQIHSGARLLVGRLAVKIVF